MSTHLHQPTREPTSQPSRRTAGGTVPASASAGYIAAVVVNGVLLYLIDVAPGWEAVPFLTPAMTLVLGLVNATLVAGLVANLVYTVADPPRLRALGDLVTTSIGLAALVRIWQVFPFDFAHDAVWEVVARTALWFGFVGSGIAIIVALARLASGRR
jgi:hypothetical protein